ncbi:MAG: noncanonical pyrimidine nucleotidase, YjjG family [Clostridiales bacterium]|jgi:2-haloacid dehalogenase|nr:noncanonical pyrimidine nucleotidase, YjjG family [Clostridiales bacterium]
MYQYLLFDADNTLLNFDLAEQEALHSTLIHTPLGYSDDIFQLYHTINELQWKRLERGETTRERLRTERFIQLYETLGYSLDSSGAEAVAKAFLEHMSEQSALMDGALETVAVLAKKYALYIVTNATAWVQKKRMARTPLAPYFQKVYISHDMGCAKPERIFFDKVLTDIGDNRRESYLVIGDSLSSDVAGARGAGLDSCYFDPKGIGCGSESPKWTIHALPQLLDIL